MIINREDRAVFTHQLEQRRRGRPRVAPRVQTSIKLPEPVFDALCLQALREGESLHATLIKAARAYAANGTPTICGSQTNHGARRAW